MVSDDGPQHPTLLASGRTADVFALSTARVVRRYRENIDAAAEAIVMEHVTAHGFPAPTVHRAETHQIEMDLHKVPPMPGADPDSAVLHLDLHPDNVILTASGPIVIDWTNAAHGPADHDVALSALILAQVAVDDTTIMSQAARDLLRSFVACVGVIETEALARVAVRRRRDPMMRPGELDRLENAVTLVKTSGDQKSD